MLPSSAIKQELTQLIGLPVWGAAFAAGMLMVQFGSKNSKITRLGTSVLVGDYALHIQVSWRLATPEFILVGNDDFNYGSHDETHDVLTTFMANLESEPKVVAVNNVFAGAFTLALEGGVHLDIFPSQGAASDDEFWRILRPTRQSPHFVVSAAGVEHA